jgi:rod shape-determining protein MreB
VHRARFLRRRPRVLICVPCGSTQVERRAIKESAEGAGARDVFLIEEPMAAAIGAGIPVHEARGSMVHRHRRRHLRSRGDLAQRHRLCAVVRIGGDKFDESIINYVRRNHGTLIGESTAERIKMEIGCAYPQSEVKEIDISGRNLAEGVPRQFTINSNEILEALHEPLAGIVSAVKAALEQDAAGTLLGRRRARHRADRRRRAAEGPRPVCSRKRPVSTCRSPTIR